MRFLYTLLLFVLALPAFGQSKLIISQDNAGFGLLNPINYTLVVPNQFTNIQSAPDGTFLATLIKESGTYVYFDENGKEFLRFQDEKQYTPFSEGFAIYYDWKTDVENSDPIRQMGYINKKGKIIVPPIYQTGTNFHEGIAIVTDFENNMLFINQEGKVIANLGTKYEAVSAFSEGLAYTVATPENGTRVFRNTEEDYPYQLGKIQYIDKQGKVVIDLSSNKDIMQATAFRQGLVVVGKPYMDARDGMETEIPATDEVRGVIDRTGKFILPIEYQTIEIEPTGTILATRATGEQTLFDNAGKVLLNGYYKISPLFGGHFRFVQENSQEAGWGVVDVTNNYKLIVPMQYTEVFYNAPSDFWAVEKWDFIQHTETGEDWTTIQSYAKEGAATIYTYSQVVSKEKKLLKVYDRYGMSTGDLILRQNATPFEYKGKWGILNNFEIKAIGYDSLTPFSEVRPTDLMGVQKRNKWGYINPKGEVVIPLAYNATTLFTESYAIVQKGDKWGLISKNNKPIGAFEFDAIEYPEQQFMKIKNEQLCPFEHFGLLKAKKNGLQGLISTETGKVVIPFEFEALSCIKATAFLGKKAGKYGIHSFDNKILLPYQYDDISVLWGNIPDWYAYKVKQGNAWGLLGSNFKPILPTQYDDIKQGKGGFKGGNLYITKDNKIGLANTEGKILLQPEYEQIKEGEKYIEVKKNGKEGILNLDFSVFIPCEYDDIEYYHYSFTPAEYSTRFKQGNLIGLLDRNGKVIVPPLYEEIDSYPKDNMIARKAGKYGVINAQHKTIVNFEYDLVEYIYTDTTLCLRLTQNNKQGVSSNKGTLLLPLEYDEIGHFMLPSKLLMGVKKKGKWGYINGKKKMVIPAMYDDARIFEKIADKQYAVVKKGAKWGVIDHKNKIIIPFEYDEISLPTELSGKIGVQKGERNYSIDFQGREVK